MGIKRCVAAAPMIFAAPHSLHAIELLCKSAGIPPPPTLNGVHEDHPWGGHHTSEVTDIRVHTHMPASPRARMLGMLGMVDCERAMFCWDRRPSVGPWVVALISTSRVAAACNQAAVSGTAALR